MKIGFDMFIETEIPTGELIVSRTDLKGVITYANETFATISGYSQDELIGQPHNLLRHPDMPRRVFAHLWETIKQEQKWKGYVKNLRKDGGYYWVFAEISGVYKNGELVEYKSLRHPVPMEKRHEMQAAYDTMRMEDEGLIRTLSYLPFKTYQTWMRQAKEAGVSPEAYLARVIGVN